MSKSKVLFAVLAGAAIGGVVGLLLAPQAGKESREKLRENALNAFDSFLAALENRLGGEPLNNKPDPQGEEGDPPLNI